MTRTTKTISSNFVVYLKAVFWESWRWIFTFFDALGVIVFLFPGLAEVLSTDVSYIRMVSGMIVAVSFLVANFCAYSDAVKKTSVFYQARVGNDNWTDWFSDGRIAGTTEQSICLEAIRIKLESSVVKKIGIRYQVHVEDLGWMDWKYNNDLAGLVESRNKRIEAIRIEMTNALPGFHVFYQAYVEGNRWMHWVSDGDMAGTTGESRRLEAIRIIIVNSEAQEKFSRE